MSITPPLSTEATHDTSSGTSSSPSILTLEVGPMAHGGHCVARHEGRVIFVRHAIPGEIVRVMITAGGEKARFWRADTIEVVRASEFRRAHQWKLADSLRAYHAGRLPVGGAEYGHITLEHQRRLKAQVFRDTMQRIGKLAVDAPVHSIEADEPTGLHWRTRNRFAVNANGRITMHAHRTPVLIPVRNVPLAVPLLDTLHLWDINFSGAVSVDVATPAHGEEALIVLHPNAEVLRSEQNLKIYANKWRKRLKDLPDWASAVVDVRRKRSDKMQLVRLRGRTWVKELVESAEHGDYQFRVTGDGFWQAHRDAPATLVNKVMEEIDAQPGEVIADLYGGAGLFSAFLARAVGEEGCVLSVEGSPAASKDARKNLHQFSQAVTIEGRVDRVVSRWLERPDSAYADGGLDGRRVNKVVLDPPRTGAGQAAIQRIHELDPETIVYVSCDPASFARDARWLTEHGWELTGSDVYDLFPDTHHMESVNVFRKEA